MKQSTKKSKTIAKYGLGFYRKITLSILEISNSLVHCFLPKMGNLLIVQLVEITLSLRRLRLHGAAQVPSLLPNIWPGSCTVQIFSWYGLAFKRGRPSFMGMCISILISTLAPFSLTTTFQWPLFHSIPSSTAVLCKFLFG